MIASIFGTVSEKEQQALVIETGGVGYRIFTTLETASSARVGESIKLYTYLQVREEVMALFGFVEKNELDFFEMLITVSGVGPKMALSVLSAGNSEIVRNAIAAEDVAIFTKIGGVGRKTAEKIIVELKDKVGVLGHSKESGYSGSSDILIQALEQLGYSAKEIKDALPRFNREGPVEEQLREALKVLGRR